MYSHNILQQDVLVLKKYFKRKRTSFADSCNRNALLPTITQVGGPLIKVFNCEAMINGKLSYKNQ